MTAKHDTLMVAYMRKNIVIIGVIASKLPARAWYTGHEPCESGRRGPQLAATLGC